MRRAMIAAVLQTVAERTGLTRKTDTAIERDATLRSLEKLIQISRWTGAWLLHHHLRRCRSEDRVRSGQALSDTLRQAAPPRRTRATTSAQAFLQQQVNEYPSALPSTRSSRGLRKQRNLR